MAKYSRGMQGQKELDGMPPRGKLGDKAIEYLNAKDEMDGKKDQVEKIRDELVELFLAEGKTALKIDGRVVSVSPKNGYKVTVKESLS